MKFQTLALTTVIGLSAVTVGMAQDAATRSLLLRGTNTVTANVGTLTVPALTAPRTYTLQNQGGTVALQTPAVLGTNRVILSDASGKLDNAAAMTDGQLLVGSTGAAPVPATPTGTRGLAITLGAGSIDFALPTGSSDALLRYNGTNWVSTGATFTSDATGNTAAQGDLTLGAPLSTTGGSLILNDNVAGTSFNGTIQAPSFTANRTIDIPDASGTILLSTGGTANQLTRWGAGGTSLVDASLSDNGTGTLARAGNIAINPGTGNFLSTDGHANIDGDLTVGTSASVIGGTIFFNDNTAGGTNQGAMSGPVLYSAARTYTLPDASGTVLLSTGGTAGQMTRWGAGGTSIVDASLSDNGTGTLARAGNVALNTGAGNTLSTDASFQVDGSTTLGNDNTDFTRIRGDIDLNVTNTAGNTVNINTSANANTTNIGNASTVANVTAIYSNSLGAGVSIANGNAGAGTGLAITDAFTNGLTIGTGTPPVAGIRVNATTTGIVVNTGAGNDLTINQDALTRNGDITIDVTNAAANNLVLNNIQVSNPIQDILWITATNQVRRASFSGTANEGIEFSSSAYRLGTATAGNAAANNPLVSTRYVNLDGQTLSFNRGAATDNMLSLNGTTGVLATDATSVNLNNNVNLGNGITDVVRVNGTVAGSENRILGAAATNTFAGRIHVTEAVDGAGPGFTILNSQVTANSTIIVTIQSNTPGTTFTANVSAIVAATSFDVTFSGGLGVGDDLYINYMIINP
ncbi:MAG: hypothetical protein JSS89_03435 [Bacteroidetes bacterium]|nr:hypothetical protein [Bacteroidota bacterium]